MFESMDIGVQSFEQCHVHVRILPTSHDYRTTYLDLSLPKLFGKTFTVLLPFRFKKITSQKVPYS